MLPKKTDWHFSNHLYSSREEVLNVLSHAIGFILSIVGLIFLLNKSVSSLDYVITIIYGMSLALMFLSSSIYHAISKSELKKVLRKVDHIAIYLLIAGSYTPFLLKSMDTWYAQVAAGVIWLIAVLGIIFKLTMGNKYPKISISTYAVMGWMALFMIYPIYQSLSPIGFTLLLVGGLCYSAGIPLYLLKSRDFSHALWHIFVVAGAACHYFAIYYHVF